MRTFIIAEMGASHCQSLLIAKDCIEQAAWAGADAVKLQTFDPDRMAIPEYTIEGGPWHGRNLRSLYRDVQLPREWHEELFQFTRDCGMTPMSTPFHQDDVTFLESIGCERYKIASFEATDLDLIQSVADTKKPFYISTGQMDDTEVEIVMDFLFGNRLQTTLLHCVSSYPADLSEANLIRIRRLHKYGRVGISDHTKGVGAAPYAVALGARVVEKHIMSQPVLGEDRGFALLPHDFKKMVEACREIEKAVEHVPFKPSSAELRRSVWCCNPKTKGDVYTEADLVCMRPWSGVSPMDREYWLGRKCSQDHEAWTAPR